MFSSRWAQAATLHNWEGEVPPEPRQGSTCVCGLARAPPLDGETTENHHETTQNTFTINPAANPAEHSAFRPEKTLCPLCLKRPPRALPLRHLWPGHPSGDRQQLNNSAKPESWILNSRTTEHPVTSLSRNTEASPVSVSTYRGCRIRAGASGPGPSVQQPKMPSACKAPSLRTALFRQHVISLPHSLWLGSLHFGHRWRFRNGWWLNGCRRRIARFHHCPCLTACLSHSDRMTAVVRIGRPAATMLMMVLAMAG